MYLLTWLTSRIMGTCLHLCTHLVPPPPCLPISHHIGLLFLDFTLVCLAAGPLHKLFPSPEMFLPVSAYLILIHHLGFSSKGTDPSKPSPLCRLEQVFPVYRIYNCLLPYTVLMVYNVI
jgi:hypothetical protein